MVGLLVNFVESSCPRAKANSPVLKRYGLVQGDSSQCNCMVTRHILMFCSVQRAPACFFSLGDSLCRLAMSQLELIGGTDLIDR